MCQYFVHLILHNWSNLEIITNFSFNLLDGVNFPSINLGFTNSTMLIVPNIENHNFLFNYNNIMNGFNTTNIYNTNLVPNLGVWVWNPNAWLINYQHLVHIINMHSAMISNITFLLLAPMFGIIRAPINRFIIFFIAFFSNFGLVGAINTSNFNNRLITGVGWLGYFLINSYYDFVCRRFMRDFPGLFMYNDFGLNRYSGQRVIVSVIFLMNINIGVLMSTGFYVVNQPSATSAMIAWSIFSFFSSSILGSLWFWLGRLSLTLANTDPRIFNLLSLYPTTFNVVMSLARGSVESLLFVSLSWLNFAIWNFYTSHDISHNLIYAIVLGTGLFPFVCHPQVLLEERFSRWYFYGIIYTISFSLLSIGSSGLWYLYADYSTVLSDITLGTISAFIILAMPFEIYRVGSVEQLSNINHSNRLDIYRSLAIVRYNGTYYAFVILTGILIRAWGIL